MKKLSIAAIVLSVLAIVGEILICASSREDSEEVLQRAGEKVPLSTYYVHEGLDLEVITNMYRHSSTMLYFKRANRYFPIIEPILKKNGIPSDFKYLCVIESGLTNATSPAKAQGFWQFIPSTGANYGLTVNDEIDMRNNLTASKQPANTSAPSTTSSTAGPQPQPHTTVARTAWLAASANKAPTTTTTFGSTPKQAVMCTVSSP